MKKAKLKGRVFYAGIIAAVIVVLTGLGACDGFVLDDLAKQDAAVEQGIVDENGLVAVKVVLPDADGGSGRSVSNEMVRTLADYYEIIFRDHTTGDYTFASANVGESSLIVSLKAEEYYDILFLAGRKVNQVLLASAFVNNRDGNVSEYDPGGVGYQVKTGGPNVITLEITRTNLRLPDLGVTTPDITFSGGTDPYTRGGDNIATLPVVDPIPTSLEVSLADTKLLDLIRAVKARDDNLDEDDVFESNEVTLIPRYQNANHVFTPVTAVGTYNTDKYDYSIATTALGLLPGQEDFDGLLRVELTYFAFGDSLSKSTQWNIRNGLSYAVDDNGVGGAILVEFGDGSEFPEEMAIVFNGF